ncbi:sugar transferase [Micromonospora sp. NPDC005806]|uniref:sugar transferase n=1 Tax=Micromonospora sp. NPDC005806 TaxID=3364234 RepID=UPI0036A686CA
MRHEVQSGDRGVRRQVRRRSQLPWEGKFAYDVEYVDRRSLGLDLPILVETVFVVLRREGIGAQGSAPSS